MEGLSAFLELWLLLGVRRESQLRILTLVHGLNSGGKLHLYFHEALTEN